VNNIPETQAHAIAVIVANAKFTLECAQSAYDKALAFASKEGIPTVERWHATVNGYTNHKCRCQPCTEAWATYSRNRRVAAA
jgi:hypothetical protein